MKMFDKNFLGAINCQLLPDESVFMKNGRRLLLMTNTLFFREYSPRYVKHLQYVSKSLLEPSRIEDLTRTLQIS